MITETPTKPTEEERVRNYRTLQLMNAGYSEDEASRIGARNDVDWHWAIKLLELGCPPETAVEILL